MADFKQMPSKGYNPNKYSEDIKWISMREATVCRVHWPEPIKGGGGTIALYAAKYGIEVLDCGPAVLSMHSPFEVVSKIDIYISFKGFTAFLREM